MKTDDNTAKIAELNDLCRKAMGIAFRSPGPRTPDNFTLIAQVDGVIRH